MVDGAKFRLIITKFFSNLDKQPCDGTDVMTCLTIDTWQCPNGDTGVVPPGTVCSCNAFRPPGWIPSNELPNKDEANVPAGLFA